MELDRRDFLKGVAAAGGAAAFAGLAGCAPKADEGSKATTSEADPIPALDPPDTWDDEADVVVVGTGGGGLNATTYAAENGASVIAIEKGGQVGGATRHAAGYVVLAGGTTPQNERGYGWPAFPLDPDAAVCAANRQFQYSLDDKLQRALIVAAGEGTDWMMGHEGIDWINTKDGTGFIDMDIVRGKQNAVLGMNNACNAMEAAAKAAGAKFMMSTKAEALVAENGRVVGVMATETASGDKKYIKANKGVILCTGGMGVNRDLLEKYIPTAARVASQLGPMPSDTGDGFRMGLGVGADYSGWDSWCGWEGGIDESNGHGDGEDWHYFYHGERQLVQNSWLIIDKRGQRVPYYSTNLQPTYKQPNPDIQMGDLSNVAAWCSRMGSRVYPIFDADYPTNVFKICKTLFADQSRVPITSETPLLPTGGLVSNDWQAEVDEAIERGAIVKADTIEELAEKLGLDPDVVVPAVDRWNEICANGVDTDLVVPYITEWLIPVKKAPFYSCVMSTQIGKTLCGLRVDENLQVINTEGKTIPGLYANFMTAGGVAGESSFCSQWNPSILGGQALSWVSGYLACKSLLAGKA
ncbi:MAG: FAD-dependent oxidoreductase [Coriobacteriia bacterium]